MRLLSGTWLEGENPGLARFVENLMLGLAACFLAPMAETFEAWSRGGLVKPGDPRHQLRLGISRALNCRRK